MLWFLDITKSKEKTQDFGRLPQELLTLHIRMSLTILVGKSMRKWEDLRQCVVRQWNGRKARVLSSLSLPPRSRAALLSSGPLPSHQLARGSASCFVPSCPTCRTTWSPAKKPHCCHTHSPQLQFITNELPEHIQIGSFLKFVGWILTFFSWAQDLILRFSLESVHLLFFYVWATPALLPWSLILFI